MEIIFLRGAEAEVQAAFEHYADSSERRAGLFLQRLDNLLGLLRENPDLGPIYGGRFRRLVLRGFYHAAFYTVTGDRIFIAAMLDLRQDPARLHQRLGLQRPD